MTSKLDHLEKLTDATEQVDERQLMVHIDEFARRTKLSGTVEELQSFQYVEMMMRHYGFSTELILHDAYISLPISSLLLVNGRSVPSITHSMAASTPVDGIDSEIVYVGRGDEAGFAASEVRGKIALIDGIAAENITVAASRAGAIGQIHVSPNENLYEMCLSPIWGNPSQYTKDCLPNVAISTIAHNEGLYLREQLASGQKLIASMKTVVDTSWRKTPLLIAEKQPAGTGVNDKIPFILLSGHHDTWHCGVMDNGAANAAMIEAARVLGARANLWRRGLRLCFWSGHSQGRYSGSAWYADENWFELEALCAAHVNLDSLGGKDASNLAASGVVDELKHLAKDAVAAIAGQSHSGNRHGRMADQSFWGIGIPSIFDTLSQQPATDHDGQLQLGWWWHTPHDLPDKIDPKNLSRDCKIAVHALARLLGDTMLPYDYLSFADALLVELNRINVALGDRLDITMLVEQAQRLKQETTELANRLNRNVAPGPKVDRAFMRLSRALVPINYTSGERFEHDPALPQAAWPSLDGIRQLARLERGNADIRFYVTHAARVRNRVSFALREALSAIEDLVAAQAA